ncbi:hypothetical protein [uncultured Desulfuromusa sp.]|uniref:hypothetical protein n=1 Tax=uncultured Desulfuromusa sp. TaxID=219183 RepID=UPI002AA67578|nr:hypothetical protein [uncultured Desulfuromusa sp.]
MSFFGGKRVEDLLPGNVTLVLVCAFILSFILKISLLKIGSPFITIDDNTAFEGGFLVWFGQAPPQRMYLESWICGLSSLLTYIVKMIMAGNMGTIGLNLIADAYRDFYGQPDTYVQVYRFLMITVDMVTAYFIFLLSRKILGSRWHGWAAALPAVLYLFSYNTFWCDVVARPDTLVVFFSILGLFLYYKSDFGVRIEWFWAAAVLLGLAAGMKLHAAFFAIFLAMDLLRVHGLKKGSGKVLCLSVISFFFFCFAAGSLFADPLTYIKLRMLNIRDDVSPWIQWGEQFVTILRGSGWLVVPVLLCAVLLIMWKSKNNDSGQRAKSIIFQSVCWLLLFSTIRQLRAYWMLPVLPLFYISAVYALSQLRKTKIAAALAIVLLLMMGGQSYSQFRELKSIDFNELRTWVQNHAVDKPIYIFGYEALMLPKNTICIQNRVTGLNRTLKISLAEGLSFTYRHLKNWEERSALILFDILGNKYEPGYEYYGIYSTPLDSYSDIISLDKMSYVFVQAHFPVNTQSGLEKYLQEHFTMITELTGAGGGGAGLKYKIYERKAS